MLATDSAKGPFVDVPTKAMVSSDTCSTESPWSNSIWLSARPSTASLRAWWSSRAMAASGVTGASGAPKRASSETGETVTSARDS